MTQDQNRSGQVDYIQYLKLLLNESTLFLLSLLCHFPTFSKIPKNTNGLIFHYMLGRVKN